MTHLEYIHGIARVDQVNRTFQIRFIQAWVYVLVTLQEDIEYGFSNVDVQDREAVIKR